MLWKCWETQSRPFGHCPLKPQGCCMGEKGSLGPSRLELPCSIKRPECPLCPCVPGLTLVAGSCCSPETWCMGVSALRMESMTGRRSTPRPQYSWETHLVPCCSRQAQPGCSQGGAGSVRDHLQVLANKDRLVGVHFPSQMQALLGRFP